MNEIKNKADYQNVMVKIDGLMAKGSGMVSKEELDEIRQLAESAQAYEQKRYMHLNTYQPISKIEVHN
jgi:HTH-type transcriptional regulator/antitoxin HigA